MESMDIIANVPLDLLENFAKNCQMWTLCFLKLVHVNITIANMEFVSYHQALLITFANVPRVTLGKDVTFYLQLVFTMALI